MVDVSVATVGPMNAWGTWEELILGGAVLRHGTGDWDVVASELRTRTVYPYYFTPEACKAKYEDLQHRYTGCKFWYDELRERRVAELKRELEKSEESIGVLVSKIKTFRKERSKDVAELSAGSFTQDLETNPQPEPRSPSLGSSEKIEVKLAAPESCVKDQGGMIRKRRGKRKRKDGHWEAKDRVVDGDNLGSGGGFRRNETSTSGCGQTILSSSIDLQDGDSYRGCQTNDLVGIFNSVTENQYASVFRRRLDSQKRARYRKIIKQHMDLETVKSRIANCCIKTTRELFRDLLLLTNNALVFYSKRTREYKSALAVRGIVTKRYKQLCSDSSSISSGSGDSSRRLSSILCFSSMSSPPVRPRSVRPRALCIQPKLVVKFPSSGTMASPRGYLKLNGNCDSSPQNPGIEGDGKSNDAEFSGAVSPKRKLGKALGRPRRVGGGGGGRGGKQPPPPPPPLRSSSGRKKARQK